MQKAISKLHITPANAHECKHCRVVGRVTEGTTVYADKGYDSAETGNI
ncbi:transposase IS4 family [Neisseria meningitidis]|nr:transposase IS4 family [Neisseria meningitidis]